MSNVVGEQPFLGREPAATLGEPPPSLPPSAAPVAPPSVPSSISLLENNSRPPSVCSEHSSFAGEFNEPSNNFYGDYGHRKVAPDYGGHQYDGYSRPANNGHRYSEPVARQEYSHYGPQTQYQPQDTAYHQNPAVNRNYYSGAPAGIGSGAAPGTEYDPYQRVPYSPTPFSNAYYPPTGEPVAQPRANANLNHSYDSSAFYQQQQQQQQQQQHHQQQQLQHQHHPQYQQNYSRYPDMNRTYGGTSNGPMASQSYSTGGPWSGHASQGVPSNPALQDWFVKYNQWWHFMNNQRKLQMERQDPSIEKQRLTPFKFPARHARVCFNSTNQLLLCRGTTVLIQQLDPGLIDVSGGEVMVSTWPGPLVKEQTTKDEVLEYIRTQEGMVRSKGQSAQDPREYASIHQIKQIWLLLLMLMKQNGEASGADLAELLLSQNETEFESSEEEATEMTRLRRYLMLGQRKTALEFASKSSLWGHAFTLTFLSSPPPPELAPQPMGLIQMVSKFINSTLSPEDPLFNLYRCLLQKQQEGGQSSRKLVPTANLQQFAILLANECEVSPVISGTSQTSELLKFIVAIRSKSSQFKVNVQNLEDDEESNRTDDDFSMNHLEELVFMNEIWEFGRNLQEYIISLVPLKLLFAARLFDFGFIDQAIRYCYVIKNYYHYRSYYFSQQDPAEVETINWPLILTIVNEMESRVKGCDVSGEWAQFNHEKNNQIEDGVHDEAEESIITGDDRQEQDINKDGDVEEDDEEEDDEDVFDAKPHETERLPLVSGLSIQSNHVQTEVSSPLKSQNKTLHPPQKQLLPQQSQQQHQLKAPQVKQEPIKRVNQREERPRTVSSLSNSSSTATPPPTPTVQGRVAINPLPVITKKPEPGGVTFFVPPVPTLDDPTAEPINFVSTAVAPAFHPVNDNHNHEKQVNDSEDEYYGRAVSQRHQQQNQTDNQTESNFNSTTAPGSQPRAMFSPPLSPISSPRPEPNNTMNMSRINESNNFHNSVANENKPKQEKAAQQQEQPKGIFGSFFSKMVPSGPKKAILPDDKNPSIVWDEASKRWVDKTGGDDGGDNNEMIMNGPPKMPMMMQPPLSKPLTQASSQQPPVLGSEQQATPGQPLLNTFPTQQFSFIKNSNRQRRYVDIFQEQQQPKPS